jgi:4-amino-4-deoxy-L-arabinose transferase-like glycosyltransferase
LLALLCCCLFFYHLADRDLWSSHEGRAAQDAQSILDDGSWGLPRLFDHKVELQKPPLYYWTVAALARLRGGPVDAWAVRLPAALAGLAGVCVLYLLAVRRGRARAGLIAALVLATALHYTWLARTGRIDMPLTLAVTVALAAFYLGQRRRHEQAGRAAWWHFLAAYIAVAFAVMLKGPIGVILPGTVAAVSLVVDGDLPLRWRPRAWGGLAHRLGLWWGLPLVLALAAPWYVWADVKTHGGVFRTFFWYHNVERALGGSGVMHEHAWWHYGPLLATGLLPWSILLPCAGWSYWRNRGFRVDPEARFGLVWFATMTLVLSCAQFKRADYLLPAYPGAALFLACVGDEWLRRAARPWGMIAAFSGVTIGCGVGWWVYVDRYLPRREAQQEDRTFAAAVRRLAPAPQPVIFFRTEAHALAFHVAGPLDTILEWENLDWWAARPQSVYVIMPPEIARQWPAHLKAGRLEEVLRNTELAGGKHKHPLVLLRTRGPGPPAP